ncbi:MAG: hypothetical protein ABW007_11900, partial [Chitinophagaceae bacterium]
MRLQFLLATLFLGTLVTAQSLPTPRNIQATYTRGTRAETGRPGTNYWQNTADYNLDIRFDPATRILNGVVDIAYYNNSPDTLKQIWLKLYPNVYKKGAPRSFAISPNDESDGLSIDSLWINGAATPANRISINATNGILSRQALASKEKINIRIAYHYTLNKGSHNRTGEI